MLTVCANLVLALTPQLATIPLRSAQPTSTALGSIACRMQPESSDRRQVLAGLSLLLASGVLPGRAEASYALYQASQSSFDERKATNYVPVATNDRATLSEIQDEISRKRPRSERQLKKPPQYCAGQMAAVQPMMENVCANIGISKADQSNTMRDEFGNMNVGTYTDILQSKRR